MKAILVTDPDWSSRTTSDWSDCADRNIWDDLYDMMSAIQEKWKTLEEMLKEIAEITDCSKNRKSCQTLGSGRSKGSNEKIL